MCEVSSLDYPLTSLAPNRCAGVDEYMIIHWKSGKSIVQNLCPEFLSPCMNCSCTQYNWTSLLPSCKIAVALTLPETKHPLLQKKKKTVGSPLSVHNTYHAPLNQRAFWWLTGMCVDAGRSLLTMYAHGNTFAALLHIQNTQTQIVKCRNNSSSKDTD
jgi:hypothetical protein